MDSDVTFPRVALLCFGKLYTGMSLWLYLVFRKVYMPETASEVVGVPDTQPEPELFSAKKENSRKEEEDVICQKQ